KNKSLVRFVLIILVVLAAYGVSNGDGGGDIPTQTSVIFSAETVAASGTASSRQFNLSEKNGDMSVSYTITGTGTATIDYLMSNDDVTYTVPDGATSIIAGATAGSDLVAFFPEFAKFIKIRVTETGGANAITITAIIAMQ
ncbi:MAG: hypothetical protein GY869_26705, partial [Planctomycetes bacterium]|nr:hypothetical protein [Planctomycetota bacterium]